MDRSFVTGAAIDIAAAVATGAQDKTVMVGGAAMYPTKDIVDNAVNSKDHTTLVAAVKAAGLVETLKGAGPAGEHRQAEVDPHLSRSRRSHGLRIVDGEGQDG